MFLRVFDEAMAYARDGGLLSATEGNKEGDNGEEIVENRKPNEDPKEDYFGMELQIDPPAGDGNGGGGRDSNRIKVMLDGDILHVSAAVDIRGAKKLLRRIKANIELLKEDEDDEDETGQ